MFQGSNFVTGPASFCLAFCLLTASAHTLSLESASNEISSELGLMSGNGFVPVATRDGYSLQWSKNEEGLILSRSTCPTSNQICMNILACLYPLFFQPIEQPDLSSSFVYITDGTKALGVTKKQRYNRRAVLAADFSDIKQEPRFQWKLIRHNETHVEIENRSSGMILQNDNQKQVFAEARTGGNQQLWKLKALSVPYILRIVAGIQ